MTRPHAELAEALARMNEEERRKEAALETMLAHRADDRALTTQPGDEPLLPDGGLIDEIALENATPQQLEALATHIIKTAMADDSDTSGKVTDLSSWSKGSATGTGSGSSGTYTSLSNYRNWSREVDYPAIPEAEGWTIPQGPVTKLPGIPLLIEMLTWRRPSLYGKTLISESEQHYRERYIMDLPGIEEDAYGNLWTVVGDDDYPSVLWSSHTDTVHAEPGRQKVHIKGDFIELHRKAKKKSNCLGADDTVGNWIMREMILAGVPGLYVFHFGEESGCHGSGDIAKYNPGFLSGIQAAIAFDRRRYGSVITHQSWGRCCSDAFASSLARQLPGYTLDDGGIFTDTAKYMDIVPECTNLSVGYFDEHSSDERLNLRYAAMLRDAMVRIDTAKLVIQRDPQAEADAYFSRYSNGYGSSASSSKAGGWPTWEDEDAFDLPSDLESIVQNYPKGVAAILEEYGFDAKGLWDELCEIYGFKSRHS